MKRIFFKRSSMVPYWAAALASVGAFGFVIFDMGKQHPFGTPLVETGITNLAEMGSSADLYEIVYIGQDGCDWCKEWRQVHLPIWRQYDMSEKVQLTMQEMQDSCVAEPQQVSQSEAICQTGDLTQAALTPQPSFALIDRRTGDVIKTGKGIDAFYQISREAARRIRAYESGTLQAKTPRPAQDKA